MYWRLLPVLFLCSFCYFSRLGTQIVNRRQNCVCVDLKAMLWTDSSLGSTCDWVHVCENVSYVSAAWRFYQWRVHSSHPHHSIWHSDEWKYISWFYTPTLAPCSLEGSICFHLSGCVFLNSLYKLDGMTLITVFLYFNNIKIINDNNKKNDVLFDYLKNIKCSLICMSLWIKCQLNE